MLKFFADVNCRQRGVSGEAMRCAYNGLNIMVSELNQYKQYLNSSFSKLSRKIHDKKLKFFPM